MAQEKERRVLVRVEDNDQLVTGMASQVRLFIDNFIDRHGRIPSNRRVAKWLSGRYQGVELSTEQVKKLKRIDTS